ncbi:MAG: DUF4268 domain-containing protein [Gemmatimonadaceae bacterium]|nr:DUF4268 domain-containing protein [Chitinophagaceae bacterium]
MFARAGKQEFWTAFGKYMSPVPGSDGEPANWLNYRTGVKGISFRLNATERHAVAMIEFGGDGATDNYRKFSALKAGFGDTVKGKWVWVPADNTGNPMLFLEKNEVNVYRQEDWPAIISFFKQTMLELDEFWSEVKAYFE